MFGLSAWLLLVGPFLFAYLLLAFPYVLFTCCDPPRPMCCSSGGCFNMQAFDAKRRSEGHPTNGWPFKNFSNGKRPQKSGRSRASPYPVWERDLVVSKRAKREGGVKRPSAKSSQQGTQFYYYCSYSLPLIPSAHSVCLDSKYRTG